MWMFRLGRLSSWTIFIAKAKARRSRDAALEDDVRLAARDLTLRDDEDGLSVYRVDEIENAGRVAVMYAVTVWNRPDSIEYVLIPDRCLEGYECVPTPSADGALQLRELHHEIFGLRDAAKRDELARRVLSERPHETKLVDRIREQAVIETGRELSDSDDDVREHLAGEWPSFLMGEESEAGEDE